MENYFFRVLSLNYCQIQWFFQSWEFKMLPISLKLHCNYNWLVLLYGRNQYNIVKIKKNCHLCILLCICLFIFFVVTPFTMFPQIFLCGSIVHYQGFNFYLHLKEFQIYLLNKYLLSPGSVPFEVEGTAVERSWGRKKIWLTGGADRGYCDELVGDERMWGSRGKWQESVF